MATNVELIKSKLDIAEVIGEYIKTESAGVNFKARCPFHNEKTPSFFISTIRQTFYCFGCNVKGDIFSFVEHSENVDFRGALAILATKAGVDIGKGSSSADNHRDQMYTALESATEFFALELAKSSEATGYLDKRGLSTATREKWRIGFVPSGWRSLMDHLLQSGYTSETLLACGLIKQTTGTGVSKKFFDTFRGRIMFPIFDRASRVVGFSGRTMLSDVNIPKYLNSPETELFHKSEILFGQNFAREGILKTGYSILVEGQIDLIMMHQESFSNTVATLGTALTQIHLDVLGKYSKKIVLCYDGDDAGDRAMARTASMSIDSGFEVKVISIPRGEDPGSILGNESTRKSMPDSIKASVGYVDLLIAKVKKLDGVNATREASQTVLPVIAKIKNGLEQGVYIKKLASVLGASEELVRSELAKIARGEATSEQILDARERASDATSATVAGLIFWDEDLDATLGVRNTVTGQLGEDRVARLLDEYRSDRDRLIFTVESDYGKHKDTDNWSVILNEIVVRLEQRYLESDLKNLIREMESSASEEHERLTQLVTAIQERLRAIKF